jgi:hypothetical protein
MPQVLAGAFVRAAHQVDLCERVEDRARRFVEEHRAAHLEGAVQHLFCAFEIAEQHERLPQRGECDGKPVSGSHALVQVEAPFRKRERLVVAMAHQRDVGLIVDDTRQDIVGLDGNREPFRLAERGCRFVVPP